jgi:cellulose synthase operon protein YhjU
MDGFIPEKPYHDRLGTFFIAWWCWYFIGVAALHFFDYIIFNTAVNVLLAITVATPFPPQLKHYRSANNIRHLLASIFALTLLWQESRLPPPSIFIEFFTNKTMGASPVFLAGLFLRSINIPALILVVLFFGACILFAQTRFNKWYPIVPGVIIFSLWLTKLTPSTLAQIETIAVDQVEIKNLYKSIGLTNENLADIEESPIPDNVSPEEFLFLFYENEKNKRIEFPRQITNPPDVYILQVCSFGWEDFTVAGVNTNPFFSQFDYIFTNFNSADSYSHTSAIRLLRGMCGQTPHENLFQNTSEECYVMDRFRSLGYKTFSVFNHDGIYSDFTKTLTSFTKIDQPKSVASFTPSKIGFDNSKIYNDYEILSSWFTQEKSETKPLATFYNSISLHAGTHGLDEKNWWKRSNESVFKDSVGTLTQDMTHFFNDIKSSGRPAVVIVVAEHGAALKNTPVQLQTFRQIPLPDITNVPAAIKLFGPGFSNNKTPMKKIISSSMSYTGLYTLLGRILEQDFSQPSPEKLTGIASGLPQTDMVATSDTGTVIKRKNIFYYKNIGRSWEALPPYISLPSIPDSF